MSLRVKPRLAAFVALAVAAAGGVAVWMRRQRSGGEQPRDPRTVTPDEPAKDVVEREWSCECGQAYRITGEGRHRVYWRRDASVNDPVIDGKCVSCDRALPAEPHAAAH